MANLIVAILAIILMGALSVIGLSYIGSIYMESQADSQATELVANAGKVASALRSWSAANGSNTLTESATKTCAVTSPATPVRSACWDNGVPLDLINGNNMYLDALPQLGSYAQGDVALVPTDFYFKAMPIANVAWTSEGTGFDSLFAVITSTQVCKAIARLAGGDAAVPVFRTGVATGVMGDFSGATGTYSSSPSMTSYEFNCVVNDTNSNGTLDSGESMFFIYKVF